MTKGKICPSCKGREYKTAQAYFNHLKKVHPAIFLSLAFYEAEQLKESLE